MSSGKVTTLTEAIARFVHDGHTVYLAGFTHAIPFAAGHEIIRQRRRNLILARATPDLICDQMIAAGCARKLIFSWGGNPGVGSLRAFRRAVERGELEIEEYTHFAMLSRLAAGASGLPFFPLRSLLGSDLPGVNPQIRTIRCPFTGEELAAVPSLRPDVTVVHAQRADAEGNVQIWGIVGDQREAAFAASRVIACVEEVVDELVVANDPNRTMVPGEVVSAVVAVPFGAHPSYVQGYYDRDNQFYIEWDGVTATPDGYAAWLDAWVHGVRDRQEYAARLGQGRLAQLQTPTRYTAPVNYGTFS
ncbi:MAG: CoA transferase subunit A [Armatimonadetes bacterium]|nr:CoA transferase subunit A [Armatimonadota bacterium]